MSTCHGRESVFIITFIIITIINIIITPTTHLLMNILQRSFMPRPQV